MYMYAPPDPTWMTENVIGVMEKVTDGGAMKVWERLIDEDLLEDINSKCSTEKELVHTCADIFVNCYPNSSWERVARGLYDTQETAAVEEVRSYLNPRGRFFQWVWFVVSNRECMGCYYSPGREGTLAGHPVPSRLLIYRRSSDECAAMLATFSAKTNLE